MTVTERLLKLFRVDEQIEGLQSRLRAAERFLETQNGRLEEIRQKHASVESQVRQLNATAANLENEAAGVQERIETLRAQMNEARTNKQYQAFLVEVNGLKSDKEKLDDRTLETMNKVEELKGELSDLETQRDEQERVVTVAEQDRTARESEIKDRLEELRRQREALAQEVPAEALSDYDARRSRHEGEEVMAPIEAQDMRRHEFTCGSCMMNLPFESVMSLLSRGDLTPCPSCQAILYLEGEIAEKLTASARK